MRYIRGKVFIRDLRSGLSAGDLQQKHKLSPKGLREAIRQVVKAGILSKSELNQIALCSGLEADFRRTVRTPIKFPLVVSDINSMRADGLVKDISENGIGLEGLMTSIGEERAFYIQPCDFDVWSPFWFRALCRWVKRCAKPEEFLAGFEITEIDNKNLAELKTLIRLALDDPNYKWPKY